MSEMVVLVDEKDHPIGYEEKMKAHSDGGKLKQEFGFDTKLKEVFSFVYKAEDPKSGLTEHEFDHVFLGEYNGVPKPNPQEIDDWKWVTPTELKQDLSKNPEHYTPWLKPAFDGLVERNGIKL